MIYYTFANSYFLEKNMFMAKSLTNKTKKKNSKTVKKDAIAPKVSYFMKPEKMTLEEWQIALRRQIAEKEPIAVLFANSQHHDGVFHVTNSQTRQSYKVVYRGDNSDWNYCSCIDFKTNQLGTCKHIEAVKKWISDKKIRKASYTILPPYTSVYLSYKGE